MQPRGSASGGHPLLLSNRLSGADPRRRQNAGGIDHLDLRGRPPRRASARETAARSRRRCVGRGSARTGAPPSSALRLGRAAAIEVHRRARFRCACTELQHQIRGRRCAWRGRCRARAAPTRAAGRRARRASPRERRSRASPVAPARDITRLTAAAVIVATLAGRDHRVASSRAPAHSRTRPAGCRGCAARAGGGRRRRGLDGVGIGAGARRLREDTRPRG